MTPFPREFSGPLPDLMSEWAKRILETDGGKFTEWKPTRAELAAYLVEASVVGLRLAQDVILRSEGYERKSSNRRHVLDACFGLRKELAKVIEACG